MSGRSRRKLRRQNRFDDGEDINPIAYTANFSDAMLILAVGIMLALIVHWNVDVSTTGGDMSGDDTPFVQGSEQIDTSNAVSFDEADMEAIDAPENVQEGEGMNKLGEVYYDAATGKYYILENSGEAAATSQSTDSEEGTGE